jgi:hypothetical protein
MSKLDDYKIGKPVSHDDDDFGQHRKPSLAIVAELTGVVAQLRHAYMQLASGAVRDQQEFADGLIAPQIRCVEKIIRRLA